MNEIEKAHRYFSSHSDEIRREIEPLKGTQEFYELFYNTLIVNHIADLVRKTDMPLSEYAYTGIREARLLLNSFENKYSFEDNHELRAWGLVGSDISYANAHIASLLRQYLEYQDKKIIRLSDYFSKIPPFSKRRL